MEGDQYREGTEVNVKEYRGSEWDLECEWELVQIEGREENG